MRIEATSSTNSPPSRGCGKEELVEACAGPAPPPQAQRLNGSLLVFISSTVTTLLAYKQRRQVPRRIGAMPASSVGPKRNVSRYEHRFTARGSGRDSRTSLNHTAPQLGSMTFPGPSRSAINGCSGMHESSEDAGKFHQLAPLHQLAPSPRATGGPPARCPRPHRAPPARSSSTTHGAPVEAPT